MHYLSYALEAAPIGKRLTNGHITVREEDRSFIVFTGPQSSPDELFQLSGKDPYRTLCNLVVMLGGSPEEQEWKVVD